mmetsp:Transcript_19479/g.23204  ORF Transcript_19479/g.23204 Transcript_19479/m.23204 type:complete len:106 (-) Transcript_19479:44-361(-)
MPRLSCPPIYASERYPHTHSITRRLILFLPTNRRKPSPAGCTGEISPISNSTPFQKCETTQYALTTKVSNGSPAAAAAAPPPLANKTKPHGGSMPGDGGKPVIPF